MAAAGGSPVVTLHLWGVSARGIPGSLLRMATQRRPVRRSHGIRFAKLLGTGSGETFSLRDADPRHWGLLAVWDDVADARVFELGSVVTAWDHHAYEKARFVLSPIHSRGSWNRQHPFSPGAKPVGDPPIAAITRARVKPSLWRRFAGAVPPVAAVAADAPGLLLSTGIGEAPIGLQGTFSVWQDTASMRAFASGPAHQHVVAETERLGWYGEELFARFAVIQATGTFCGKSVDVGYDAT